MKSFENKSLAIAGRLPALSIAELESLYGAEHVRPIEGGALLDVDTALVAFKRIGGTIKLAKILATLPTTDWKKLDTYLLDNIPRHLKHLPEGAFTLGLSAYNMNVPVSTISRSLMSIKKVVRGQGRRVRVVPNKTPGLNSAQVLHNKLTTRGAWELLLVRYGHQTILAQTMFVQDIEAYGRRDHGRPKRDARVGMLPPKLAQTIINLATEGPPQPSTVLLDPFCGTGVVLQEALLMGYQAYGTDIEPRMVEYSAKNLEWLETTVMGGNHTRNYRLETADATNHTWDPCPDLVAAETYLGRPFSAPPPPDTLRQVIQDVDTIHKKFFRNIAAQLKPGTRLCLAVPTWRLPGNRLAHLPVLDHLTDMGYNYLDLKHVPREELVYFRENQTVARQLIRLMRV